MKLSEIYRIAAALAVVALLSACAIGAGDSRYRLIAPQVAVDIDRPPIENLVLAVGRPQSDRARDSSRILVRRGRDLLPWPEAAWADRAPELLQGIAVETLDGRLATVVRHGTVPADYRLGLDLRRFELVEGPDGLEAQFVLGVRMLDASGALIGATTIDASGQRTAGRSLDAAMSAMESAISAGLEQMVEWLRARLDDH